MVRWTERAKRRSVVAYLEGAREVLIKKKRVPFYRLQPLLLRRLWNTVEPSFHKVLLSIFVIVVSTSLFTFNRLSYSKYLIKYVIL
jgi:hypothetical protein